MQRQFVKKQEGEGLVITECVKVTLFFVKICIHQENIYICECIKNLLSSNPKTVYYE